MPSSVASWDEEEDARYVNDIDDGGYMPTEVTAVQNCVQYEGYCIRAEVIMKICIQISDTNPSKNGESKGQKCARLGRSHDCTSIEIMYLKQDTQAQRPHTPKLLAVK